MSKAAAAWASHFAGFPSSISTATQASAAPGVANRNVRWLMAR
jgi:hypothetical protein